MILIWHTTFWCNTCGKEILGQVFSRTNDELPETEKQKALDQLKHYHQLDQHLSCFKCGKKLQSHEIEDVEWTGKEWRDLCKNCASVLE